MGAADVAIRLIVFRMVNFLAHLWYHPNCGRAEKYVGDVSTRWNKFLAMRIPGLVGSRRSRPRALTSATRQDTSRGSIPCHS